MPSLRKRVTSYFRQLSFHNEPREHRLNLNENSFVTKYLQGQIKLKDGPPVVSGKNPADLPDYDLDSYAMGPGTIVGCYTGPNGGLTTVKRTEKHLSVADPDIDFIDTQEDNTSVGAKPARFEWGFPIDNTSMVIKVAGQEYFVTNRKKQHGKSQSLGSLSNFNVEIETTRIDPNFRQFSDNNVRSLNNVRNSVSSDGFGVAKPKPPPADPEVITTNQEISGGDSITCNNKLNEGRQKSGGGGGETRRQRRKHEVGNNKRDMNKENVVSDVKKSPPEKYEISKSKSEGNPFQHRRKLGKIIQVQRPISTAGGGGTDKDASDARSSDDFLLPEEWGSKSDRIYGLSDSLYDRNQVTKSKNGDPIADCFGIIGRKDSAILAVADGVNWGEKACIAAKSAIHGCLHYLNRTIFNDTKPFEDLVKSSSESRESSKCCETPLHNTRVTNTQEVFVCLLRAFNCAHDLILENDGMLTTLTVAVVLPLKPSDAAGTRETPPAKDEPLSYVCCVCNVGDTLAYVYSKKHGVRELTKGSHDIHCNRDMRDALGALGPVDGINPELSNLTLSITTVQKGDIIFLASDGLTDNFDPNVCKFTVNTNLSEPIKAKRPASGSAHHPHAKPTAGQRPASTERHHRGFDVKSPRKSSEPPVKPPRRHHASKNKGGASHENKGGASHENNDKLLADEISKTIDEMTKIVNRTKPEDQDQNPLVVQFLRDNSIEEVDPYSKCKQNSSAAKPKPVRKQSSRKPPPTTSSSTSSQNKTTSMSRANPESETVVEAPKYSFLRSKTSIDLRPTNKAAISRNEDGLPYVNPVQRYELTLLLMEDILRHGISGRESACVDARQLCENLLNFTFSITAAKRHTLEDNDLYFDNQNGLLVEVSSHEKKARRKKGLERVQNLPGKLDHVTVVASNVGHFAV